MTFPEHDFESLDLDFRESQPAITQAMRKRIGKAWANAEMGRDLKELEEKDAA